MNFKTNPLVTVFTLVTLVPLFFVSTVNVAQVGDGTFLVQSEAIEVVAAKIGQ